MKKVNALTQKKYVEEKILIPAIDSSFSKKIISEIELRVLKFLIKNKEMEIKTEDLKEIDIKNSRTRIKIIANLKEREIVKAKNKNGRIYTINFLNNYIFREVISMLKKQGFVDKFLEK
jgi:hypothetical protein